MSFYSYDSVNKISIFLKKCYFFAKNFIELFTKNLLLNILFSSILGNLYPIRDLHNRIIAKLYLDVFCILGLFTVTFILIWAVEV